MLPRAARADGMVYPPENVPAETRPAATESGAPNEAGGASLSASLADEQAQAQKRQAVVKVRVNGLRLVDPAAVGEKARSGEGHISYRVDEGPLIETTSTTLSLRDLDSGSHEITVLLSGNDHAPLGPSQTLEVTIP